MIEYVCGFMFDHDPPRQVLLVRKSHPEWQKGKLNGVGGKVGTVKLVNGSEGPETNFEAMVRKFYEETGVMTSESVWELKVEMTGPDHVTGESWTVYFFAAHWPAGPWPASFKEDTDEPAYWYLPDRLPANVIPNLRWLIPLCLDPGIADCVEIHTH